MPIFGARVTYSSKKSYYPDGQIKEDEKDVDGRVGLIAMASELTSGGTGGHAMYGEVGIELPTGLATAAGTRATMAIRDGLNGDYLFPEDNLGNAIGWEGVTAGSSRIETAYPAQSGRSWIVFRSTDFVPNQLDPTLNLDQIVFQIGAANQDASLFTGIADVRLGILLYDVTTATVKNSSASSVSAGAQAPVLRCISPSQGSTTGGTNVTLTGFHFKAGSTVSFRGDPATNVVVVSANQITCTTPASAGTGAVPVVVKDTAGNGGSGSVEYTPFHYV
jgi:hypothetical protein